MYLHISSLPRHTPCLQADGWAGVVQDAYKYKLLFDLWNGREIYRGISEDDAAH